MTARIHVLDAARRLVAYRAALYALVVLATMPACFVRPVGADVLTLLFGREVPAAGFAAPVSHLAYALVPWTPLLPFALVRRGAAWSSALAAIAMVAVGLAAVASRGPGLLVCAALAASVASLLADLDREQGPSALLALAVFAIGGLVAHNLSLVPDRIALVVGPSPTGHATASARSVRGAVWLLAIVTMFVLLAAPSWLYLGRLRIGRGVVIVAAGLASGVVLRVHAYPELIAQISPARAFEAWRERHKPDDDLALLGISERQWRVPHDTHAPKTMGDPESAAHWLLEPSAARRFVAIGPNELPRLNAAFRSKRARNLPIIGGTGAFLLGVNELAPSERSENPLDGIVRSFPPDGIRPLAAKLGDSLEVLGWEIADPKGNRTSALARGTGHVRVALRVSGKTSLGGHCTFIHVDHTPTRYGAEHREHAYPMTLWRENDVLIDDFEVDLPPQFRSGTYALYWGAGVLPCQDDRRIPITAGPSDGHNRVLLGRIEVRS